MSDKLKYDYHLADDLCREAGTQLQLVLEKIQAAEALYSHAARHDRATQVADAYDAIVPAYLDIVDARR